MKRHYRYIGRKKGLTFFFLVVTNIDQLVLLNCGSLSSPLEYSTFTNIFISLFSKIQVKFLSFHGILAVD